MKTTIGIFKGKGAENNKFLLKSLYLNGPLSAWEQAKMVRDTNLMSLHAIFNKSLRSLEKKGYIKRIEKKWFLQFKGILAVLFIQSQPSSFSEKWNEITNQFLQKNSSLSITIGNNNTGVTDLTDFVRNVPIALKEFDSWITLANCAKKLMENGIINFDVIKNESLFLLIVTELTNGSFRTALGE
jgi:hypothetical protein